MNDLFSLYSISVYNLFIISVFNGDLCSFKLGAVMNIAPINIWYFLF